MDDTKLKKLEFYCARGIPIFPLSSKQPAVAGGFYAATADLAQVKDWHAKFPIANWGMRTGDAEKGGAGILVIDIDPRNGGDATWEILREENPEPIETVTVRTGGGGTHYWFLHPPGASISSGANVLGPGVDVKADRGYVVIPPSITEQKYRFELNPAETAISEMPEWILAALTRPDITIRKEKSRTPAAVRIGDEVSQGSRHQALTTMAGSLRRVGLEADEIEGALTAVRDKRFADGDHPVTDGEISEVVSWVSDKGREFALTDLGNAERFLLFHRQDVRYCFAWQKWLSWDGRRWVVDDAADIIRKAHAAVRAIYAEAANTADEDKRKAIARHAIFSEGRSRVENMINQSRPYVPIRPEELDHHPMLLNVRNGIVDLATGDLMPHSRDYLITRLVDIDFKPDSECPEFEKFITLITGSDAELSLFLQLAVGYTLTGRTDEHCLFFLHGSGMNGKTTFTEVIRRLLGDYAQRIEIEALMQTYSSGGVATPHVASMAGARFVLGSEIAENRKLNESLVKDLTGGDSMTARFLFSNPFTFTPTHKLWLFGNHKPRVAGTDWGFWRRMRVLPFAVTIPEDVRKPFSDVMAAFDAEREGILSWAVLGAVLWHNNGLDMPEAVKAATTEYRTEQDTIQQFIDERCEMHPDYQVEKDKLYTAYKDWCDDAGEEQARRRTKKWLTRQISSRGFGHGGAGNQSLMGIRLKA